MAGRHTVEYWLTGGLEGKSLWAEAKTVEVSMRVIRGNGCGQPKTSPSPAKKNDEKSGSEEVNRKDSSS